VSDVTEDGFLNGRLKLRQPKRGFRAGLDAVMLAAAVPARAGETALELGAGVGTASLCVALRTGCDVTGLEIDPQLADLANQNAALNAMADRARFETADALAWASDRRFDHVFCNPPFHDDTGQRSPDAQRARALRDAGALKDWVRSGLEHVASKGSFTIVLRADRLKEVLAALPSNGVTIYPPNGVTIYPLLPHEGEAPKRVIVQIRNGSSAPQVCLSGLILHKADGAYTPEADDILRGGKGLTF
jgi:tRNA1(Val) A37 N6-methylase TrmN6